jgi:Domain of unknown function (DUF4129)
MAASLTSSAALGGGHPSTATLMTAKALSVAAFPATTAMAAAAHPIGRGAAQRLARTELSKAIYHPHESLIQRILGAIYDWLNGLFETTSTAPGGWWGLVALAALTVIVIAVIMTRIGPVARGRRRADDRIQGASAVTASEHRSRADRLASAGDYSAATLEIVRAIARQLEEQGVLAPRIGRTSGEFANEAGHALPSDAGALRDTARLFDDVCYGQGQGTQDGYQGLRALDAQIAAARTGAGQQPAPVPVTAGGSPR